MKKKVNALFFLLSLLFGSAVSLNAQQVLQNVYDREITSLNGNWEIIVDPFDTGYYDYRLNSTNGFFKNLKPKSKSDLVEYDFVKTETLKVPGDWNTQSDRFFFYEGSIWYKKDFTYQKKYDKKAYLYFGAANYLANVYLNGEVIGTHEGGFTPFSFDITDKVKEGDNFVILRVNNDRKPEGVPTVNSDWWNYGGITRDVLLVETPVISLDDYSIHLTKGKYNEISGYVQTNVRKEGLSVKVSIPELKLSQTVITDQTGKARLSIKASPELWSPESPKLYDVELSCGDDILHDKIGFRQIETRGKGIYLNGKKVFLRGISIHEEAPFRQGRVATEAECRTLLGWAKELGCNFVRLAHYPHNEKMVRAAEEMGLMVWDEIPVYWTIHWDNPETFKNASNQLCEMINRDKNRCAVVVWSIANETPHSDARDKFLSALARQVRCADNTRLLSMAMEVSWKPDEVCSIDDNMSKYVDIISFNCYLGWYGGKVEDCKNRKWDIPYDKPFFVSELGAGALQGFHGGKDERFTEEYQEELYKQTLAMYDRAEGFSGMSPWILMDFRSARRQLHGVQDFFNRKGLISENGQKKKAFYVLQDFYKQKKEEYTPGGTKAGVLPLAADKLNKEKKAPHILLVSGWQDVNIGDIAHTPGLLNVLKEYIPNAKITLWKWAARNPEVAALYKKDFPDVEVVYGRPDNYGTVPNDEVLAAINQADILVHGSGPMVVAHEYIEVWRNLTDKPYGIFGVTTQNIWPSLKNILNDAAFILTRETASLAILKEKGITQPEICFVPDAAFALNIRDDKKAGDFMKANELEERKFLVVIPRLRKTPYWLLDYRKGEFSQQQIDEATALNNQWKEVDHAKMREAIIRYVRETGNKVLVCPEMTYQVDIMDELIINPLPEDVKKNVIKRGYWMPDEAASLYSKAFCVLSIECHSPIMALKNGTPAIYIRQPEDTIKGQMYYDLGFSKWVFEIDKTTGKQIGDCLMEIQSDYEGAQKYRQKGIDKASALFKVGAGIVKKNL